MDVTALEDIGLTKSQAATYKALVELQRATAPAVAAALGESRTNTYKVLDRLCSLGLASRDESAKKVTYFPASPTALEHLIDEQRKQWQTRELKLKNALPGLVEAFTVRSEQPSIRYFQGKEGIQQIFTDMLHTGRDIYLLRSPADVAFYDESFYADFRKKRALLGLHTYALTPDISSAVHNIETDFKNKFVRSWIPADDYTAAVEWDVYGDKIALISYGKEAMGIIIESPQMAESFKQVFKLLLAIRPAHGDSRSNRS